MLNNHFKVVLRNSLIMIGVLSVLMYISCSSSYFQDLKDKKEITKEYSGVKTIDISTVSGNCEIIRGDNSIVKVSLTHLYRPAGTFEPIFEQEGDVLKLKENMLGSNSGSSDWILSVPQHTNILFKSASGNISLEDITGKLILKTASGEIEATDIKISENSEFTSASGDVYVRFSESPEDDVLVSSASGTASLGFNNNPIAGTIEMRARNDIGDIYCHLKFDTEKEEIKHNQGYIVKRVIVKKESPIIKVYTASGTAKLKK